MVLPTSARTPGIPPTVAGGGLSKTTADTLYPDKATTEAALERVDPGAAGSAGQFASIDANGDAAWETPAVINAAAPAHGIVSNMVQDYSSTLQGLIDDANAAWDSGSAPTRIILPSGTIDLNSTVTLKNGVHLIGQGANYGKGTQFLFKGDSDDPAFDSEDTYLSNCRVEDICIAPWPEWGFPPPTGTGHGMVLHAPVNNSSFKRIMVARMTGNAIHILKQTQNPADKTGAGNTVFEQIFAITNGGYGCYAEGYHQIHFLMPDFNGNALGDFHFKDGSGNQSAVLITNLWAEAGGTATPTHRIRLSNMGNQQVTLVSPQFSNPASVDDIVLIDGATAANVNLIGASQFNATNWINDTTTTFPYTIPASDRITWLGERLTARIIRVQSPTPFQEISRPGGTNWRVEVTVDGRYQIASRTSAWGSDKVHLSAYQSDGRVRTHGELEVDGDLNHDGSNVGFYGATPVAKPNVTGSTDTDKVDSLLTALSSLGLITDNTT